MRIFSALIVFFISFFIATSSVSSQTVSNNRQSFIPRPSMRPSIRPSVRPSMPSYSTRPINQQENAKNKFDKHQQVLQMIMNGFEKRLSAFDQMIVKIQSRKEKLAQKGKDVSVLENKIIAISIAKENAQASLALARQELSGLNSTNVVSMKSLVRSQREAVQSSFKELIMSVRAAVQEIRSLSANKQ